MTVFPHDYHSVMLHIFYTLKLKLPIGHDYPKLKQPNEARINDGEEYAFASTTAIPTMRF